MVNPPQSTVSLRDVSSSRHSLFAKPAPTSAKVGKGRKGYADTAMIVPGHHLQWFPDY
jgi:hypothetical protein